MKNKWGNYAIKEGKIKQSYLRERFDGDKKRKTTKPSSCNSPEQSREKQEEVIQSSLSKEDEEVTSLPIDQINFTSNKEKDNMAKAKLGSGARFKAVEKKAAASGAENPAGVAAAAGMKKYGKAKMEKVSKAGKTKK